MPRFKRAHPSSRIQLVLHVRVAVSRPAHESCAANNLPARMLGDDLFAAQTILCRKHNPLIEVMSNRRKGFLDLPCLRGHDGEVAVRNFCRTPRGLKRNVELMFPADTQSIAVERERVIFSPHESPNLRNAREVRRIQ